MLPSGKIGIRFPLLRLIFTSKCDFSPYYGENWEWVVWLSGQIWQKCNKKLFL